LLLLDLPSKLLLGLVDGLDPLLSILFELLDLVLKTLLILLIFLLVLALDDLLGLFSYPIELDILGSLLKVLDLKIESLLLVSYPLEELLEVTNLFHQVDFFVSLLGNLLVLVVDDSSVD